MLGYAGRIAAVKFEKHHAVMMLPAILLPPVKYPWWALLTRYQYLWHRLESIFSHDGPSLISFNRPSRRNLHRPRLTNGEAGHPFSVACFAHIMEMRILNTTRQKRWNGKPETLQADFLKEVISKMETYGDRVQFTLTAAGRGPNYRVINSLDKKMAFDSAHHLLQGTPADFDSSAVTPLFSLEEMKLAHRGGAKTSRAADSRATGARTGTAASKILERIDTEKYEYFKSNRQMLPSTIGQHSDEITQLMKNGMSAQEAFDDVLKRHF
jgi:hypothetical protein